MTRIIEKLEARLADLSEETTERADVLNSLTWELWTRDRNRAVALTEMSDQLCQKLNYTRGKMYVQLNRGVMLWQNELEKAMSLMIDALEWFEENGEKAGEGNARGILGIIYWGMGDYDRGFDHASRALETYQEINDIVSQSWAYNTLASFYYDLKNDDQALENFKNGLSLARSASHEIAQGRAMNGIGNIYHRRGEFEKALEMQEKSLEIQQQDGHRLSESRTLNDIGLIYQSKGDYNLALEYHMHSLQMRVEEDYPTGQTTTLLDLGQLYTRKGEYDKALEYLQKALDLSQRIKAKPKVYRAYRQMSAVYELRGDFKKGLEVFKKFRQVESEVFQETATQKLGHLKTSFEIGAARNESELYRLNNVELREKNEQLSESIRQLNAAQARLLQTGKMAALGKLTAGIAHEINNPVGTIQSGMDLSGRIIKRMREQLNGLGEVGEDIEAARNLLAGLNLSSDEGLAAVRDISDIIHSLKNFSRLDEAEFQRGNILAGLESTLVLIRHQLQGHVTVIREFQRIPDIYFYPTDLNQVFMNLLLNALQATPSGGSIKLAAWTEDDAIFIRISDTGKGIPREQLTRIFEPAIYEGRVGIIIHTGLYSSYTTVVNRHRGSLAVESEVGKGTSFTIRIPNNLEQLVSGESLAEAD